MVSLKSFKLINECELAGAAERDDDSERSSQLVDKQSGDREFQFSQSYSDNNQMMMMINANKAKTSARVHSELSNNNNNNNDHQLQDIPDQVEPTGNDRLPKMRPKGADSLKSQLAAMNENNNEPEEQQTDRVSQAPSSSSSSSISIVVVQHHEHSNADSHQPSSSPNTVSSGVDEIGYVRQEDELSSGCLSSAPEETAGSAVMQVPMNPNTTNADYNFDLVKGAHQAGVLEHGMHMFASEALKERAGELIRGAKFEQPNGGSDANGARLISSNGEHFEIVWSNLSYKIEPKWYKKINFIDKVLSQFSPGQTIDNHSSATSTASSSAGMNDNQHQMHHQHQRNADSHLHGQSALKNQKSALDPIEIFANLNGTIKSGQMTAILGPSGAGKTTLLNCLTGKLRKGVSGHINLIGANGKHLKMCTIPQKDHLLELLTVEENLWFASKIKNPEYGFDHVKNIERVVDLLGLKRCRSAKIKKISGGQHKRVSIAQELLSNPDILVLDEPTSGLDSLTCFKTISMLRDLVELSASNEFMKPMAIIVTIHQPQPKVFNLFHHVYIMANGGRVIYEGGPQQSLATITSVTGLQPLDGAAPKPAAGGAAPGAGSVDPASFLIEIASEEYGLEPIKTLNEHQRRVFHESQSLYRQAGFECQPSEGKHLAGGIIGRGFSSEFAGDPELGAKAGAGGLSTVFVANAEFENHLGAAGPKSSRPKRRKSRTAYSIESAFADASNDNKSTSSSGSHGAGSGSGGAGSDTASLYMSEQLLYTREANHKGRFWSHTATLTHRTLLTIRRDPLLMTSRVLFHLMIPILMGHVYGTATGAANACPHYEPEIDITSIPSLVEGKRIEFMLEELHMSIENVSMFFIIMYAFAAAVLALNALSFPLNMQVLLKETRNGWYSMGSYVVAKTLADLPLELTMPCLTMALVYPLTGQPSSYLQWRMLTICLIMTLCSLIAQTQALILGALVMNSVQTAVFVSQASQLPWVILAGFTIRIKRLSEPLKLISLTSFYRLGCEAITLTRYGFGICPCDPQEISGEPVRLVGIPDQLRTLAQYWIDSMEASKAANNDTAPDDPDQPLALATTTLAPPTTTTLAALNATGSKTDIFQHLADQLSFANSYGVKITSCEDVAPDRIRAINLGDNWLVARIWHLFIMLIIMKILLYYAVRFSIGIRL